ncbi:MAG: MBL fold metallo-hydrolase [Flavisolibacter sp.]|jgi:glyoxylase-like metal-dependent hydrolase (beta-lactamase superfamily II)|nr:MBL fold metallo-hydrolase [Flavisolibacter sp.]
MNRTLVERREQSATEERSIGANSWLVAPGVWRLKDIFVNVYIIQNREGTEWVLVDTGLKSTGAKIKSLVAEIFGSAGSKPKAIIMTHGHFDHRGSLLQLADEWGVPVYCHHKERPYLTGIASYPPADPSVGGGALALLSFTYPKGPINAEAYLRILEADQSIDEDAEQGKIAELEDWKWYYTPGHTPGHISLFRENDGVLIAGDAIVTTMQESLLAVATQKKYLSGPPKYFTPDWGAATRSVKQLAALEPNVIATGHGPSIYGDVARKELHKLVREFWKWGLPAAGRYVKEPAEFDENGIPVHIPSPKGRMLKKIAFAAGLLVLGYIIMKQRKQTTGLKRIITGILGKTIMKSSMGAVGAVAPANPAIPAIPLIPAL